MGNSTKLAIDKNLIIYSSIIIILFSTGPFFASILFCSLYIELTNYLLLVSSFFIFAFFGLFISKAIFNSFPYRELKLLGSIPVLVNLIVSNFFVR